MASQQDIERWVVTRIVREVHDGSTRLSDSSQGKLHSVVRERMPATNESGEVEIDEKELAAFLEQFAKQLREKMPEQESSREKVVVRRSLLRKVIDLFSEVWPFGE